MLKVLFRLLIPSWRFFDQAGTGFFIEWKEEGDLQWQPLWPVRKFLLHPLIYNASGNLRLAIQSEVERFVQVVGELAKQGEFSSEDFREGSADVKLNRERVEELVEFYNLQRAVLSIQQSHQYDANKLGLNKQPLNKQDKLQPVLFRIMSMHPVAPTQFECFFESPLFSISTIEKLELSAE